MKINAIKVPGRYGIIILCVLSGLVSCKKQIKNKEQLTIAEYQQSTGIPTGNTGFNKLVSSPNTVLLTGLDRFRLIPIYKISPETDRNIDVYNETTYESDYYYGNERKFKYFMPGLDKISGYNLINIGHYDIETGNLTFFFENPVLIRNLYFPGVISDSLNNKAISRDYFLISVYDEDTNKDSLINTKDLRKLYHIDQFNNRKTQIIPSDYSVLRSTYDYKNDIMYIYARHDADRNGISDKNEPVVIFLLKLSEPTSAKKMIP